MKISPLYGTYNIEKANVTNGYIPATGRYNSLSDMDFNLIADTIRCQNLKNQMNIRLMNLRKNLDSCAAQRHYQSS